MKNKGKIIEILAAVAPTLATALGGPLAGVATRTIATKLLGQEDATDNEVEAAILQADGNDLVRLREVETEFAARMKEAGIELERIAANDRDSARARQVKMRDRTPTVLGLLIILGFFAVLGAIFYYGLPESGREVLLAMVGALAAMTNQISNYFFGSSAGSKEKQDIISALKKDAA
ncbi:hypothetical protein [Phaeobacter inhibens]|uniref:hypothetical protein n=1 Tax=Phaeobacter inhibens TaxID=221822 RepID=UPI00076BB104|nr:hypothetical protein [Phaeobacter inhibens]KXF92104.1 hypothetical protein AT574_03880 [Phaeobacter inhibens]WHP69939.1 hypothetical protein QMZ01_07125 [Phaeobacter inhibens]